jgi:hypothetical protein
LCVVDGLFFFSLFFVSFAIKSSLSSWWLAEDKQNMFPTKAGLLEKLKETREKRKQEEEKQRSAARSENRAILHIKLVCQ